jgi:hypothetical protein
MNKPGPHEIDQRVPPVPRIWGPGNLFGPALILFAAFVAIVPQLIRGNSCGHDFDVPLVSYPPLTWMLGAALGAILPWHLAPIALTFLILAATGLATRALALEVFDFDALDHLPATLAGCLAIFSGFTLFTAYERCSFPEFAGGFWLPLLVLFALRDRHPSATLFRRAFSGSTVPLAFALAGAWLSNLPLGVMAGYLLAGVALLWAVVNKTWAPLLRAALAAVLGLGLAAIYWLPAALERHWVDIRQSTEDPGYNFENSWLFARHANPVLALHDVVLRQVSWIAVSMITVALAAIIVCYFRNSFPKPEKIPLAAIPIVIFFFLLPISRPLWHLLPEMPFLQYPWRWLEAVEAPMAIFFVAAIWPRGRRARNIVLAACAVLFVAATVFAGTTFFQVCYPEDTVVSVLAGYHAGAGFEGLDEYEPPGADASLIATGLPDACLVSDPSAGLGNPDPDDPDANPAWSPDQGSCQATFMPADGSQSNPEHRRIEATIPHAGYLVLRLLSYPAWRVRVNGRSPAALPPRVDGLLAVPVPQGPVDLTVDWTTTPDTPLGRWLSGISVLLLFALCLLERKSTSPRRR